MMSPRQRRLLADYEAIRGEFAGHEHVRVEPVGHLPPEAYRITYTLRGLRLDGDQPVVAEEHVVDLRLPLGYPREQPLAAPLSEVFHPNIAATYCIGDYWSAGQPLADIIAKMGDMIQYRVYNVKSPLDAVAAKWAAENESIFPIGTVDLGAPDISDEIIISSKTSTDEAPGTDETAGDPGLESTSESTNGSSPEADAGPAEAPSGDDFEISLRREVTP